MSVEEQRKLSEWIPYSYRVNIFSLRFIAFTVLVFLLKNRVFLIFTFYVVSSSSLTFFTIFSFTPFSYIPFMHPFYHNSPHRFFLILLRVKTVQVAGGTAVAVTHRQFRCSLKRQTVTQAYMKLASIWQANEFQRYQRKIQLR